MDYNLARDFILGIGWPVLIIGSVYIVFSALLFYKKMGRTPISKLVPIFASTTVITMFSLGYVATAFMWSDAKRGVILTMPIFIIWLVSMSVILYFAAKFDKKAIHYNDMLIEFSKTKDDFVAIASHQLRTPLTGMKWTIDLILADQNLHESLRPKVTLIKDSNQKLLALIANLLSVIKIESGKIKPRKESINVRSVIDDNVKMLQTNINYYHIKFEFKIKDMDKEYIVDCDKMLLSESVKNLLSNAVSHAGQDGEVKVCLSDDNHDIIISVENNGPTIDENRQKSIFDKFSRERVDSHEVIQDIGGLGLYITKKFVNLAGGKVSVRSNKKEGTAFIIRLKKK